MGEVGRGGGGEGGEEKGRSFLSFSSLPFSLPSFPFSPKRLILGLSSIKTLQKRFFRAVIKMKKCLPKCFYHNKSCYWLL